MSTTLALRIETPEKKRDYNHGLFSRVADEYDIATRAMSLGQDRRWKRQLIAMLPALPAPVCVDLACGTGDVTFGLAQRYPQGRIIGVDLTAPMIEVARSRSHHRHVEFQVGDMCRLALPDASVDIVTGSYALRNAPVLEDALREIRRVLKPGGYAAFLDFAKPANRLAAAARLGLLKYWCGAVSILVHGRPEHAYIAASLRQFPHRAELRRRLEAAGLEVLQARPRMCGTMDLLLCRRGASPE
jgi:demethylmenaquinone methyltransferase/2-methoxy-6-polyprenyl-1,4-benzoquinol methylase